MVEVDERARTEMLALYQMAVDDIERAKQWAWTIAYYTVVAQGGIFALSSTVARSSRWSWTSGVLVSLMFSITLVSHVLLSQSRDSLAVFRGRTDRCRPYFCPSSEAILGAPGVKHTWPFRTFVWATCALFAILQVGL
jgi:hypothetical protein